MITPDEFNERWGEADLFRFPRNLLEDLAIPDEQKHFLHLAGLPKQAHLAFGDVSFQLFLPERSSLPSPKTGASSILEPPLPGSDEFILLERIGSFRLLGVSWYKVFIGSDENAEGQVKHYLVKNERSTRDVSQLSMVNSSIPQFAESLLIRRSWRQQIKAQAALSRGNNSSHGLLPEPARRVYYQKCREFAMAMEQELQRIDPAAFANPLFFWPMVMDEYWAESS